MFSFTVTVPVDLSEVDSETTAATIAAATTSYARLRMSPSVSRPLDEGSGPGTAYFELLADDELVLRETLDRVLAVLRSRGVHVAGEPAIIAARLYDEATLATQGISYTQATHTLTVQTWAPDQHDVEITFDAVPGGGGLVMATVTSPDPERGSVSETFPVEILRIDRPAGGREDLG